MGRSRKHVKFEPASFQSGLIAAGLKPDARGGYAVRRGDLDATMRDLYVVTLAALAAVSCAHKPAETGSTTRDGHLAPLLKNLGSLHYGVSTKSAEAQQYFDQGLTLVYAFNHNEALRTFKEVARLDPSCAMAFWGQALALAPNINDSAIGPDREKQGHDAIVEAVKRKSSATPAEQGLIDALDKRFSAGSEATREKMNQAYADAMASVHKQFPDDVDISVLYADAVMNTMPWDYWSKSKPRPGIAEARAALEGALQRQPNNPGANHLYIHLMEASDEVDVAVPQADRLGSLVPAAGHLVHMPAHIYIRVGRYADAAAANVKAVAADEDYITQCRAQGIYPAAYYPHNIHFLNAVLAMDGRSKEALEAATKLATKHDHDALTTPGFGFAHLMKTIPYITMVRFGKWDEILAQPAPPADQPFSAVMFHFARGYAYSGTAKPGEAKEEMAAMRAAIKDPALKDLNILGGNTMLQLSAIAEAMLGGEISRRAKRFPAAIAEFQKAVRLEDALRYDEPPDWLLPPRQYLGEALLAAGRAKEAESVYREDLRRHRNNGWSLSGLEAALRQQGKSKEADDLKAQLAAVWSRADIPVSASRL